MYAIQPKNAPQQALIDDWVYTDLRQDDHLSELDFFGNLRLHSLDLRSLPKVARR